VGYALGMATRSKAPAPPPDPTKLKRESAGRYVSGDARFAVQQSSGGWMVEDAEQANELGLPLVRGPFSTLDEARAAIEAARQGPAPISSLAERIAAMPKGARKAAETAKKAAPKARPEPPPIVVRDYRSGDGAPLRALWEAAGLKSLGDDDQSLRKFAQRNPGSFLVALRGEAVIGSAMGGWDGRRGWIYHVIVAPGERRKGLATRLVEGVERQLASIGCPKVNVIVRDGNTDGAEFWEASGYTFAPTRQFSRELGGAAGGGKGEGKDTAEDAATGKGLGKA
jgi:ribosomal protein S18 acetylase RimI-like enzyme